jgi:hypothetical protein
MRQPVTFAATCNFADAALLVPLVGDAVERLRTSSRPHCAVLGVKRSLYEYERVPQMVAPVEGGAAPETSIPGPSRAASPSSNTSSTVAQVPSISTVADSVVALRGALVMREPSPVLAWLTTAVTLMLPVPSMLATKGQVMVAPTGTTISPAPAPASTAQLAFVLISCAFLRPTVACTLLIVSGALALAGHVTLMLPETWMGRGGSSTETGALRIRASMGWLHHP